MFPGGRFGRQCASAATGVGKSVRRRGRLAQDCTIWRTSRQGTPFMDLLKMAFNHSEIISHNDIRLGIFNFIKDDRTIKKSK